MRGVVIQLGDMLLAFDKVLLVVQVAVIGRDTVVTAHVIGLGHLFSGNQRLIELLAMAGADHFYRVFPLEQLLECFCQVCDGRRWRFLHEDVALLGIFECVQHQVDGVFQRHEEARHVRVGHRQLVTGLELVDEQRYHRATRSHHVAVTGRTNHRALLRDHPRLGDHELFGHGLGNAHCIDRVHRLVGTEYHHALHAVGNGRVQHVLGADDIGLDRFHGVELAGRYLLERCGMEDVVDPDHRLGNTLIVAHVADVELHLVITQGDTHVFLLLLVTAEDADFLDPGV
ncbi:hypothetical protein D3C80_1275360 [compost metagenome]